MEQLYSLAVDAAQSSGTGERFVQTLTRLLSFNVTSCLTLSVILFAIGAWGVLARRNVLVMLLSVEMMLNAVMLAFITLGRAHATLGGTTGENGQIFALFIIAIAAAEAAVGLAIVVTYFRNRGTVDTRDITSLRN